MSYVLFTSDKYWAVGILYEESFSWHSDAGAYWVHAKLTDARKQDVLQEDALFGKTYMNMYTMNCVYEKEDKKKAPRSLSNHKGHPMT